MSGPEALWALRARWWSASGRWQGLDFADERGWLSPSEREELEQLVTELPLLQQAYADALAVVRADPVAWAAAMDALADPADTADVKRRKRDMRHGLWWDWCMASHAGFTPWVTVRPERPADRDAVRALLTAAFDRPDEAALVDRLRGIEGAISWVAERRGQLAGHVLFTPVTVERGVPARGHGLGPLAVAAEHRGQGVGGALVRGGLAACWAAGSDLCVVLGDPAYYAPLSFTRAAPRWTCAWPGTEETFQITFESWVVVDLYRGGPVAYHPAFDGV